MRLVSWLTAEDALASVLLLLSQAVFSVPKNSTLSGCESGRDMKNGLHCIAWLQLGISSLFLSLCVIATGATDFTSPSTLFLWEEPSGSALYFVWRRGSVLKQ